MVSAPRVPEPDLELGDLLRYWRAVRRLSQLDLAIEAATTPRHLSFVETGRSQPSREMVLRLADAMAIPLRERNGLLLAAGFAPIYPESQLDDADLARVEEAIEAMLGRHEPYPAVAMDRQWNVIRANAGAERLFTGLLGSQASVGPSNVLRLMLEPGPVRESVENWSAVARALLDRVRRESVGGILDRDTAAFVDQLETTAGIGTPPDGPPSPPVVDIRFHWDGSVILLGGHDHRYPDRCHGPGAPRRVVLPGRRRDRGPVVRIGRAVAQLINAAALGWLQQPLPRPARVWVTQG